ncbi:MOSC domain-containing protein [Algoriphagus sp. C2-6-M1]|uniref:MOSC domain-containing protein n=1 Tax=Algoriphagus persicinus TaxID=3108754 RepID=UPI002B397B24|nr:MOSC N-terminal beta barrel domain-containing protein [Algoriphagus sp. C2-6-M1]MEB2781623.1 MOSC domain-containing protein [Algoriphagus sp. C2-6-M1]
MPEPLVIQDLYIYPIKSLAGVRLTEAKVEERGFELDRRWMLVDKTGQFLSQRTFPHMARLHVTIGVDYLSVCHISKPDDFVHIPIAEEGDEISSVTVWDDEMPARLVNLEIDSWFSKVLGMHVRLVKMPLSTERKVDPRYAVNGESVSFADGMPYLLIGQESLQDLNSRLEAPVPMNRFRPNIVFSGGNPFAEDSWGKIQIGELDFQVVKHCARCIMTTVDQDTGVKATEPLKTLATYRKVSNKILFGQNMVAFSSGILKIGDEIKPV